MTAPARQTTLARVSAASPPGSPPSRKSASPSPRSGRPTSCTLDDFFYLQADEVLSLLPPSKRKTHLKALLHFLLPDSQLLEEALQEAQAWLPTRLTPEDHFLLEELTLSPCTANL